MRSKLLPPQLGEILEKISLPIFNGKRGNIQTINVMKQVARQRAGDPRIRALALKILSDCKIPSQDHLSEAICIGNFVKESVRYVRDPDNIELLTDPVTLVDQIARGIAQGDCDDMSLLIATLLLSVGCQPYFRAARYKSDSGHYNHIYVVVYERDWEQKRQRVVLDAILKRSVIGTEVPHQSGDEFAV